MDDDDTLNLHDDYLTGDEMMDQDEENQDEMNFDEEDSLANMTENKTRGKRKRSKCWKNFQIIGDKLSDGRNDIRCNYCNHTYCLDLRKSGTTTLLHHMRVCSKTPGSTPVCGNKKLDMMVFREMIALAIIEHDLLAIGRMKEKFDKYWEEYSDILAIAAVFDPKLKFTFLEYCFNSLDPSTSKSKLDNLRKKLNKLFEVYKKNTKKTAAVTSRTNTLEENILPGYDGFYAFFSQTVGASGKSALDKYLDEPVLDMMAFKSLDVLTYWRDNENRFKELSSMACDVLSIPITTVASESSFSIGNRVLNKYRSSLLPSNVQALICTRNWLRDFEEIADLFEFYEKDKEGEEEEEEVG